MLFKVPRNIERRNASPNMDLYDYLIGAYDAYLHILKRNGKSVTEEKIYYSDIYAIKDMHALLKGELILFVSSGITNIIYNTVSEEVILKLINVIENKLNGYKQKIKMDSIEIENTLRITGSLDFLFINLSNKLKRINPAVNLAAYQPNIIINRKSPELKEQLKYKKCIISKTAFLSNDNELIILEQEISKRRKGKEELDYSYLYIPYKNITGAKMYRFDREQDLSSMEICAGNQRFTYIFENRNKHILNVYNKLSGAGYIQ